MHIQIKRKLTPITRAKLYIFCSKSKAAMMVNRAIFYGRKDMPLSNNGTKLGVLIWFKNGQIWFPISVVEISISTFLFWFNYLHYLVTRFKHPKHYVCSLIWRRMVPSQLSKLARMCQGMEPKSSMPLWTSFLF